MGISQAADDWPSPVPPMKFVPAIGQCLIRDNYLWDPLTITNPERDHDSESNGKLLHCYQTTSDFRRRKLGIVKRYDHGQRSNTETGNEATSKDVVFVDSAGLNNDTDGENNTCDHCTPSSSNGISQVTVDKRANPSTEFQNRGQ